MYDHHEITNVAKPHNHPEQRISKQKTKRQRHVATTIQAQYIPNSINDTSIMSAAPNIPARPKTIYSSSSYSSSDESQVSEHPPQVRISKLMYYQLS